MFTCVQFQALEEEDASEQARGTGQRVTNTDEFARARCRVNWPERKCVGPATAAPAAKGAMPAPASGSA
jgi:hypothetical protein